ncbi:MAG TPA: Uma2 family endonuclease [Blastocatellia bacterium]|nr:Uma2 family endonuclease [Blastocatellia bacterium]
MAWVNTSPLVKTYTLDEFWQLPEPPDHSKLELIAGVLYMTPPPEYTHDDCVSTLNRLLMKHLFDTGDRGRIYMPRAAIWTGPNTYLEPDLFYVSAELEAKMDPKHRTTADLVIEVVSPGSAIYDRNTKADTYWALGVRELWLVDEAHESIEVRVTAEKGYAIHGTYGLGDVLTSTVFPSLRLPIAELF